MFRCARRAMMSVVAGAAVCLLRKRQFRGEVEEIVRRDWKCSTQRVGLRRHTPWHDRFRRSWIRIRDNRAD
jgi:hypothetical protein